MSRDGFSRHLPLGLMLALAAMTIAVSSYPMGNNKDAMIGQRHNGDHLVEQVLVERHSIPLLKVDETVTVKGDGYARITMIEAIDLKGNGHNVKPAITRGGPGDTFVTLHFESERGHGIHYLVKVYAV